MGYRRHLGLRLLVLVCASSGALAQGGRGRGAPAQQQAAPLTNGAARGARATGSSDFFNFDPAASASSPVGESAPVETRHKITISGQTLAYTARAGYLPLLNPTTGQSEAHLFFTYYAKDSEGETLSRPILFFLGGAPGVAAAWQEFGGLGPKRMKSPGEGLLGSTDNPHTLLAHADLVFVNPVGTA